MLETSRLTLKPLNHEQLLKYAENNGSLEEELHLEKSSRIITDELKEALEQTIIPNVADSNKNYLFNTLWTAISKAENKMVGDLCIIGEPNENGEIEIGYGTYEEFQGNGYMTEMVSGIIEWAKTQQNVKVIVASTIQDNIASFRILEKNNFKKVAVVENSIHWKLEIK